METTETPAEGELQLVGTFLSMDEANFARGLLQSAESLVPWRTSLRRV